MTSARESATRDAAAQPDITARRFTALDAAMLGALALMVALHLVAAALAAGWLTAVGTVALTAAALVAIAARRAWRPLVARLLLFGLVVGVLELFTDFSGQIVARSLIYPPNEPVIWASPLYMPLSWMVTLSLIGYLAWRLVTLAAMPATLGGDHPDGAVGRGQHPVLRRDGVPRGLVALRDGARPGPHALLRDALRGADRRAAAAARRAAGDARVVERRAARGGAGGMGAVGRALRLAVDRALSAAPRVSASESA